MSSSAHMALVPWLAGWPERDLDPELRKALEVAVHAGTALALALGARRGAAVAQPGRGARSAALLAGAVGLPGVAGLTLERPIERRLGSPGSIAGGLLLGSLAMVVADRRRAPRRALDRAGALDGLLLGLGQSVALIPGVSRSGATLAVARARGFDRRDAGVLSRTVAGPVIVGAAALKTARLARRPLPPGTSPALAAAAAAAFASTLACRPLIGAGADALPLVPFALYRSALAVLVIRRLRDNGPVTFNPPGLRGHSQR